MVEMRRPLVSAVAVFLLSCAGPGWLADIKDPDPQFPPPCEQEGLKQCRSVCDDDDAAACLAVAYAHFMGHGGPTDSRKAYKYAARSCDLGSARGCHIRGQQYPHLSDERLAYDELSCRAGYGGGCLSAGFEHGRRSVEDLDMTMAAQRFRRGCDLDNARSCYGLSELCRIGLAHCDTESAALRQHACDLGSKHACKWPHGDSPLPWIAKDYAPDPPLRELAEARPSDVDEVAVKAELCVAVDGTVVNAAILDSPGPAELDAVLLRTLRTWTFHPLGTAEREMGCLEITWDLSFREP